MNFLGGSLITIIIVIVVFLVYWSQEINTLLGWCESLIVLLKFLFTFRLLWKSWWSGGLVLIQIILLWMKKLILSYWLMILFLLVENLSQILWCIFKVVLGLLMRWKIAHIHIRVNFCIWARGYITLGCSGLVVRIEFELREKFWWVWI